MFPYKTSLEINRNNNRPIYLQLANQFITLIKERKLPPDTKLPGSRTLADLLKVHRKTIVACYDELLLQGWVESIAKKGTYVHRNLPELHQNDFLDTNADTTPNSTGFSFYKHPVLDDQPLSNDNKFMTINDGISDERLTPVHELARTYRRIANGKNSFQYLSYGSTYGNEKLRSVLVDYLNKTRGLKISKERLLITRGSQMGIYLAAQLLLRADDNIIVGTTNYSTADITFQHQDVNLLRVPVDENGLETTTVETICKKKKIKAIYVTSHHHHPTTVTLSAERRIHLLNLARKYNFAIIEDDYDYDFNYNHAPILPLSSHDLNANVIYIGSVCKTVAPVFRVGYLIASKDFVDEAARLRRIVDRQGDALLELTFAEFIQTGDLDRHIRKVLKIYEARRDLFCRLLREELSEFFTFQVPKGGMAVWVQLNQKYSWEQVSVAAKKQQLAIGNWQRYDRANAGHNAIRIGFATYNETEIVALIGKLKKTLFHIKSRTI
ncbi:MAG: PLP-dependent aminotransferase family protein [Flavobacteriaceae bacterium]|nr:PLP-dependent aminotransferase family protein [Flavobacteriaceae bacterium]